MCNADAVDNMEKQALLCSMLANKTRDPKQKAALNALAQKFTEATKHLTADTNDALAHPNDKAAQDKFNVRAPIRPRPTLLLLLLADALS